MVKWCNKTYFHPEQICCNSADNTTVKWWIVKRWKGETVIITFVSHLFFGPLLPSGPIPLLHFISCCIPHSFMSHVWMVPRWLSKHRMSRSNAVWFCILPLISSYIFLLFFTPDTANTIGVCPLWKIPVSFHFPMLFFWRYN